MNFINDDNIKITTEMKKLFVLLALVLTFASCSSQMTEKVEASYPSGKTQTMRYYDRNNNCVREAEFYESGQTKMEGTMKDGQREGEWTAYFPDGRIQSQGTFKNGKRTGAATVWQENGNLLQEGFYKDGKHVGKWKFYDEQGNLLKEVDYGE